jgi:FkbM family methyltransferase
MGAFSGSVFGAILLFIVVISIHSSQDSDLSSGSSLPALRSDPSRSRSTIKVNVIKPGSDLSCETVRAKVQAGEWPDPNKGQLYSRKLVTEPHFQISLHHESYDPVRWRIMSEGKYYEDEVHQRFVDILGHLPPTHVVDVGGNIGYYTLLSAALGHSVVTFEPNPTNIQRLCDSMKLNHWTQENVHLFQNAVSENSAHGDTMMLHSPKNPGQAFLRAVEGETEETNDHKARTTLVSLDKFAEDQGWFDRNDFSIGVLKIDVEGKVSLAHRIPAMNDEKSMFGSMTHHVYTQPPQEPQVVLGAPKLLASGLVSNVLMEGRRFGRTNLLDSFAVLFEAGFVVKEPQIPDAALVQTSREKAKAVCDWYINELGANSQKVCDMWWIRDRIDL